MDYFFYLCNTSSIRQQLLVLTCSKRLRNSFSKIHCFTNAIGKGAACSSRTFSFRRIIFLQTFDLEKSFLIKFNLFAIQIEEICMRNGHISLVICRHIAALSRCKELFESWKYFLSKSELNWAFSNTKLHYLYENSFGNRASIGSWNFFHKSGHFFNNLYWFWADLYEKPLCIGSFSFANGHH